jgi:MFS family permease
LTRLAPLYVVVFIGFVGYSLMITVFTPMLLRNDRALLPPDSSLSIRTIVLGFLLCLYPLGQFVGSPILGSLSDRFGRRPVLIVSLVATTICYVLIALSISINNLALLAVASLVAGLAEANIVTAQSAIADVVPPDQRNRYFGYIYMAVSLAYIIGPLGGGKLTDPHLVAWFGDATPFWVVFGLLALTTLAIVVGFQETKSPGLSPARTMASFANLLLVFTDLRLRRFYAVNFLLYLAIFGFFRSYPMYLVDEFRLDVSGVSEFVAWVGVPIVLVNLWLTGFLTERLAVKAITVWSAALTGIFMVALILPRGEAGLWPLLFLVGASLAVCLPSCATLLSNAANPEEQGRVMGNNQAIQVGAEALSGLAAGFLAAVVIKLPLVVLGTISVVAAALVALVL